MTPGHAATSGLMALLLALPASCGTVPAATPTVVVQAATVGTAAASASAPPATGAKAPAQLGGFHDACFVALGHDSSVVLAVKEDGASFTIGQAQSFAGPFEAMVADSGSKPFRVVLEGAALDDPDFASAFGVVGVKRADVTRVTVYGIGIRGGWSFGVELFSDATGRSIGKASFGMRPAMARPCGGPPGQ
jgi:hypothetical protein